MEDFPIEIVDEILEYHTIKRLPTPNQDKYFDRFRVFRVNGNQYKIEWYHNICYLNAPGDVLVPFKKARLCNTWPRRSKMNIQFYDGDGEVCCILKVDDYE